MRDAIGTAVEEFNEHGGPDSPVKRADCKSKARYCVRLEKTSGNTLEVFLDEENDVLSLSDGSILCGFRAVAETKGLEYYDLGSDEPIEIEKACRRAIEEFLFKNFSGQLGVIKNILSHQ